MNDLFEGTTLSTFSFQRSFVGLFRMVLLITISPPCQGQMLGGL